MPHFKTFTPTSHLSHFFRSQVRKGSTSFAQGDVQPKAALALHKGLCNLTAPCLGQSPVGLPFGQSSSKAISWDARDSHMPNQEANAFDHRGWKLMDYWFPVSSSGWQL